MIVRINPIVLATASSVDTSWSFRPTRVNIRGMWLASPSPTWILPLALIAGATACRPTQTERLPEDPSSRSVDEPGSGTTGPRAEVATPEAVLLRAHGDLDGDGTADDLVLHPDGTLVAGRSQTQVELTGASEYWMGKQASLRVVDLDAATHLRAVLLELPTAEEEDPPNRVQLFVLDGDRLRRVLDWAPTGYGPVQVELPGDGSLRYVEDGWTACDRAPHSTDPVARERVTLRMKGAAGADGMTEVEREPSGLVQQCNQLAACPHVYVLDGDRWAHVGELLRHLRGAAAYERQSLALPIPRGDLLRVRIAEEKPEVTHLDAVALSVDGQLHLPVSCDRQAPLPEHCAVDRAATRLRLGDALELVFEVPRDARTIELVGWGFYLPLREP